jgi:hypothetical protein
MNGNIFKEDLKKLVQTRQIEQQINSEVPLFRNLLIENYNNDEIFHGYINKVAMTWGEIISYEFISLIRNYNEEYFKKQEYKKSQLIKLADEYNSSETEKMLDNMSIDTPGIYSLNYLMKNQNLNPG